ncbi:MAG: hypothetical protein WAO95_05370 [Burkholderiales bacterium]
MYQLRRRLAVGLLLIALSGSAYAVVGEFEGKWQNVDPNTSGLTVLEISLVGDRVKVHAWGRCHPTDCDWKSVDASAFGPNVRSALPRDAKTLMAVFKTSFSESILVIDPAEWNKLRVELLTRFTDQSGRPAYSATHTFSRH